MQAWLPKSKVATTVALFGTRNKRYKERLNAAPSVGFADIFRVNHCPSSFRPYVYITMLFAVTNARVMPHQASFAVNWREIESRPTLKFSVNVLAFAVPQESVSPSVSIYSQAYISSLDPKTSAVLIEPALHPASITYNNRTLCARTFGSAVAS